MSSDRTTLTENRHRLIRLLSFLLLLQNNETVGKSQSGNFLESTGCSPQSLIFAANIFPSVGRGSELSTELT